MTAIMRELLASLPPSDSIPDDSRFAGSDNGPPSAPRAATTRTVVLLGAAELARPLGDVTYLVPHLGLASGAPALVAGYGFSGKTIALQSLALSVAAGKRVWGVYGCERGRVIHLDFEQGRRVTSDRYQRLALGMGVDLASLAGALEVAVSPVVYLDDRDALDVYGGLFEGRALVIVDSLRAAAPRGDENSSDVRRVIDLMSRAAEPHGCVLVFIHHARKPRDGDAAGARYAIRGSGALYDACGSVFVFAAEKGEPIRVDHAKCRNRGLLIDDFGLRVEDVELGDDPRAGLRVVHLEAAQLEKPKGASAYGGAVDRIATFLTAEGGEFRGAKSSLRERLGGMGRDRFFAAFEEMISTGRVIYTEDEIGKVVRVAVGPVLSGDHPGPNRTIGPVPSGPLGGGTADHGRPQ